MTCEETIQTLSLYVDDCVSLPARVAIDEHLDRCPVCRSEAAELRSLTRSLRSMARPTPPPYLAETITDLLTIEAAARSQAPKPPLVIRIVHFLEPRLMPYTVGSCASVFMFFMMFTALRPHFVALREAALQRNSVLMVQPVDPGYDLSQPITPEVLARMRANLAKERAPFAELSPTLDPGGALAALSRSYTHQHSRYYTDADDDMTVITDVFSDGRGSLVNVVRAPRDKQMLDKFESALRQTAAFVPASLDRRPDTMRVVISLGPKVEVDAEKVEVATQKF